MDEFEKFLDKRHCDYSLLDCIIKDELTFYEYIHLWMKWGK